MAQKRPISLRTAAAFTGALVGALGACAPAFAEDEAPGDEPTEHVIVTGQRQRANPYADPEAPYKADRSASQYFTEPLLDTPKTITVLTSDALGDLGATSFRDVFRTQPGITLGTGEGGNAFGDRVFIRGFDARNDIYIDGVRDPGVATRETFAVQQIEIVKGPSSTFGGRGNTGGAVSLVSKQPGEGTWGDVEATLGTADLRRATVDYNWSVNRAVGLRFNAMRQDANVPGRDYVFSNRWGVALAGVWRANDNLTLGSDYYHLSTDFLPDWGIPYDTAHNRPFDVPRENFYGVLSRDYGRTFGDVFTARADYRFTDTINLHSVLRWGQSGNAYTASAPEQPDPVAGTVRANAKRRDSVTESYANQTDVRFDFDAVGIDHTLVVGYEISHEETLNRQRAFTECAVLPCSGAVSNPLMNLLHPDPTIPWPSSSDVQSRPTIVTDTRALYALDTLKFTEQWEAFVGLRLDDYKADTHGLPPDRHTNSRFWNWHGGLVYKPAANETLYLSYGSSSNPPCEQLDAFAIDYLGCDARVTTLDPIRNTSWELGGKANVFDGHLNVSVALFTIDRTGAPIQVGAGATAFIGTMDQGVNGIELAAQGNITPDWSVVGGITWLDTEVTRSDVAGQAGSKFPNVSEHSFSLTSRYEIGSRTHIGGAATYNSKKFGGTTAAGITFVPDYWRFDLFGGYDLSDSVELSFNVLNLTDEVYFDALYRSATPFSYIAPGRSAQIKLDFDF